MDPFGTRVLDVTDDAVGIRPDTRGPRGTVPSGTPASQMVDLIQRAISLLGPSGQIGGGILYFPKGRYGIARTAAPSHWESNLGDADSLDLSNAGDSRRIAYNPFGATLIFPPEITVWLAPGAVFVPLDGAVIQIQSALVCEPIQIFDLLAPSSRRGLVVFGSQVPRLLPQWWGIFQGEDHAQSIQFAIDAAIHHRVVRWEKLGQITNDNKTRIGVVVGGFHLPPIPVEFRGVYQLRTPIEIRGIVDVTTLLELLGSTAFVPIRSPRAIGPVSAATIVGGAWHGRDGCGATLVAASPFSADVLVRNVGTFGLTIQNLALDVGFVSGVSCMEVTLPSLQGQAQGMAIRGCQFSGDEVTLLRLGPQPMGILPGDPVTDMPPTALPTGYSDDLSAMAIDGCTFLPSKGGIGLQVRAQNSLPFRIRLCEFIGDAKAMISVWDGGFVVASCRFDNSFSQDLAPAASGSLRGFEEPDGADIFLHVEYPERQIEGVTIPSPAVELTGFTATGCISRSSRFLSSTRPNPFPTRGPPNLSGPANQQQQQWPILLMNIRHLPSEDAIDGVSVRWGRRNNHSATVVQRVDGELFVALGRASPLVILGGQYKGTFQVLPFAGQSAVVGVRSALALDNANGDNPLMDISPFGVAFDPYRTSESSIGVYGYTDIFTLRYDRARRR